MIRLLIPTALLLLPLAIRAAEPPFPATERARMLAQFATQLTALDQAIAATPDSVPLHSRRGDLHLFLAHFPQAVADFEKMIALDPAQDAPHWRLGIAYHFTGQFAKSALQFQKYHAYDGRDRENGIWKFLADVHTLGLAPARAAMLPYSQFDREPFPSLYAMFAGTKSPADILAEIKEKKLADAGPVPFFAHYYAGLQEELLGNKDRALALLHQAVANPWARTAERDPTYMWQVARLHYDRLAALNDSESKLRDGSQARPSGAGR